MASAPTHRAAVEPIPFDDARALAHTLRLASRAEWRLWCTEGMRPPNVPSNPDRAYKHNGWEGWGHWLGTGNTQCGTKLFLPFEEALAVARSLRLVSSTEWRAWCRTGARPTNVPANPNQVYKHDGWLGWEHWLCDGNLGPAARPAASRVQPRQQGHKLWAEQCEPCEQKRARAERRCIGQQVDCGFSGGLLIAPDQSVALAASECHRQPAQQRR